MSLSLFAAIAFGIAAGAPERAQTVPLPYEAAPNPMLVQASADGVWRRPICVGVTGLSADNAQYLADRIGVRAAEIGLRAGQVGCTANVLVVFSNDPSGQAERMLSERTDPVSATGVSGNTRGREALRREFIDTNRPVRWWHVTLSTNDAGENASRNERYGDPPRVNVPEVGRFGRAIHESISHVIIVVDRRQVAGLRLATLGDYLAMVALIDVDPTVAPTEASILNLFSDRERGRTAAEEWTAWDLQRLNAIY